MAAPAAGLRFSYRFRDSKGNVGHMKVLIGGATNAAVVTDWGTLLGHLQAASNAHVSSPQSGTKDNAYGSSAQFANVEDKARLTFQDTQGDLHHFEVPAPILASFDTDQESVLASGTAMATVISDIETFVYGFPTDTAALAYVGGIRIRRKTHRKANIFVLAPDLAPMEPAE